MKKYLGLVIFLAFFWVHSAEAATRTFVGDGASHNWSATGAWVEGIVPTAADDVVFSSNTVGSILVIDGTSGSPSLCKSIDTTNYTKTITMGSTAVLAVGGSTSGAFKMTAGMTFAPNLASLVKFVSTTTGNNITMAGYVFGNMTFDGVGGGWIFQDANSMATDSVLTLTNGTLDTNSQTQTNAILFSSNNANTRSFILGTTNFKVSTASGTKWDITTPTGMTLSAASSTLTFSNTTSNATFAAGGLAYGTITSTALTTGSITIGSHTSATETLSIATGATKTTTSGYKLSGNITVTGTFTAAGSSLILRNFLYSDTVGTPRTISAGTFAITNTDLRDITKAGAGSGDISATSATTGNGDCGGNTGWTFQAPRNVYMKTAVSVNWSANNWKTTSGGSTAATPPFPLCHDTAAIFDANSVTASGKAITVDEARIPTVNFTGVLNTPNFANAAATEAYGSYILDPSMTYSGAGGLTLMGRASYSFYSGGLTLLGDNITVNAPSGTYTLIGNTNFGNGSLTMQSGAFSTASYTLSGISSIIPNGGSLSGTGAYAATGTSGTTLSGGTATTGYAWSQ